MSTNPWFKPFEDKFLTKLPDDRNGLNLFQGHWKYDYELMSVPEIIQSMSRFRIPSLCAETFDQFSNFDILELGPADGYHSHNLEKCGARSILSIEGNIESFLKCLVLKNALNLRTKFMLGDFVQYIFQENTFADLVFASGVLYHLTDPVEFLIRCGEISRHIYIWTFYYDEGHIQAKEYERHRFEAGKCEKRVIRGESFNYYERHYESSILSSKKYAGGLQPTASWLDRETLFRAVDIAGFKVVKTFDDKFGGMPAVNILASKNN